MIKLNSRRLSTLAIAVAAATGLTTVAAQDFQVVEGNLKVTEKFAKVPANKIHLSPAELKAAMQSKRYLIEFAEPAAAVYKGGIPGFEATSAKAIGDNRLNVKSKRVASYTDYLQQRQQAVLAQISQKVPGLKTQSQLTLTLNGVIVEYQGNDLKEKLKGFPGVKAVHEDEIVYTDMDASNALIGSPEV